MKKNSVKIIFTLIELFMVVANKAMLLAMSLPALNRVMETALKIECTSNMNDVLKIDLSPAGSALYKMILTRK